MFSIPYLCICLYCMLQLGFLFVMEKRRRSTQSGHEKYFSYMLIITLCSFAADIVSSLYEGPAWLFPASAAGNYIEIILNTSLIHIFYLYTCEQIPNLPISVKHRIGTLLWVMTAVCAILVISTAFNGQIFYFDRAHIYHRGPLFLLPMFILFIMMVIVEAFLFSQRKNIEADHFKSLAFFLVAPLIGWLFQSFIFGLPFSLLGIAFAAQIVFTNIQNRDIDKDYLTGAFTRQYLDSYMQYKIDSSTEHKSFSALLLDIDDFKSINDCFGHYEGDAALVSTVKILRDSVGRKDFIARYGGDEFCVILETDDPTAIENIMRKISSNLSDLNAKTEKPYPLKLSIGYSTYHLAVGIKAEMFLKVLDQKMYAEKKSHHFSKTPKQ